MVKEFCIQGYLIRRETNAQDIIKHKWRQTESINNRNIFQFSGSFYSPLISSVFKRHNVFSNDKMQIHRHRLKPIESESDANRTSASFLWNTGTISSAQSWRGPLNVCGPGASDQSPFLSGHTETETLIISPGSERLG